MVPSLGGRKGIQKNQATDGSPGTACPRGSRIQTDLLHALRLSRFFRFSFASFELPTLLHIPPWKAPLWPQAASVNESEELRGAAGREPPRS